MPKFSEYFGLGLSQHELDFVDTDPHHDIPVYVDPYAIEIRDDVWSAQASEYVRTFFLEVLEALRQGNDDRANWLMSHLREPPETFLGVSSGPPQGRGIGQIQSGQVITAIRRSQAFKSGLLSDLSEMSLYVEGIDRDKISDLTTNIIRRLLEKYTLQQCELFGIEVKKYASPPSWNNKSREWEARYIDLPYIEESAVLLVPKFIVRRKLSLDSQDFYNKQITDFLISEHIAANSALVHLIKGGKEKKVLKKDVRRENPRSKAYIAEVALAHPELLELYKDIARKTSFVVNFTDDQVSISEACAALSEALRLTPSGQKNADRYHQIILGALTTVFYPDLIQPHKEWAIHEGRKRIDIVYTNSADAGFFSQRRNSRTESANVVIVECKNYSKDIANEELDQLLGRFDDNRGYFGMLVCRNIDDQKLVEQRCLDMAARRRGYIVVLTDEDILSFLDMKANLNDADIQRALYQKHRALLR